MIGNALLVLAANVGMLLGPLPLLVILSTIALASLLRERVPAC